MNRDELKAMIKGEVQTSIKKHMNPEHGIDESRKTKEMETFS